MNKILLLYLIIILQLIFSCSKSIKNGSLVCIVNESSNEIISGILEVGDSKFDINHLKPNNKLCFNFTPRSDCPYSLKIEYSTGDKLEKNVGYVTSGTNYKDKLIIINNDILFQREDVDRHKKFSEEKGKE